MAMSTFSDNVEDIAIDLFWANTAVPTNITSGRFGAILSRSANCRNIPKADLS
jgi:hypothetical protein